MDGGFARGLGIELLTPTNFKKWKSCMKSYLLGEELWEVVGGDDQVEITAEFGTAEQMKSLCAELSALDPDEPISEAKLKRHIIRGLRKEYVAFVTSVQGWATQPSLLELENLLASQESLARQMAGQEGSLAPKKDWKKNLKCFRCHQPGHFKRDCKVKLQPGHAAGKEEASSSKEEAGWGGAFMTGTCVPCFVHSDMKDDWIVDSGTKLDAKARKLVFVGYDERKKGWRCMDPVTKKFVVSRDVVFDELTSYGGSSVELPESKVDEGQEVAEVADQVELAVSPAAPVASSSGEEASGSGSRGSIAPSLPESRGEPEEAAEVISKEQPLRRSKRVIKPPARYCEGNTVLWMSESALLALMSHWCQGVGNAMREEVDALKKNETWDLGQVHPDYVCQLRKALYGLKHAPRAWYGKIAEYLQFCGYLASNSDSSLFIKKKGELSVLVLLYVDDMILTGNSEEEGGVLKLVKWKCGFDRQSGRPGRTDRADWAQSGGCCSALLAAWSDQERSVRTGCVRQWAELWRWFRVSAVTGFVPVVVDKCKVECVR
ncbi:hypothetical protein KSP39_PZI019771 [Platanthera zijinensis]|uniref:CCHC-type domain-containing protein n=1 Tax=Platanthera zijinensis TaxID=2320716 RepID=A0AAP0B2A8_9ASPA